jgi:hypothetical protein
MEDLKMADKIEHTIHGFVPQDEWHKFLKQHFAPKRTSEHAARSRSANEICGSLGCPGTFGGGKLHGCSVDIESDGSTTIHCHYTLVATQ